MIKTDKYKKEKTDEQKLLLNENSLQKGGVPAAPSGTATLLRLSPNHRFHPRPTLAVLLANPASWGRVADPSPN